MSRGIFGGGVEDFTISVGTGNAAILAGGNSITFWDAAIGGNQYTDLRTMANSPISSVLSSNGSDGQPIGSIPEFYGPPGVRTLWAAAFGGPRRKMTARGAITAGPFGMQWSVTEHGADNTGVNDAGQAINAVIAASAVGDTIYFPSGTYIIETPVLLRGGRAYQGLGRPVLKQKAATPIAAVVKHDPGEPSPMTGIKFDSIDIDGNAANNTTYPTSQPTLPMSTTFDSGVTGWNVSGSAVLSQDSSIGHDGLGVMKITAMGGGTPAAVTNYITAYPGRSYSARCYTRAGTTGRNVAMRIDFFNASNSLLDSTTGTVNLDNASGWSYNALNFVVAPANTAKFTARVMISSVVNGEVHYVDDVTIAEDLDGSHGFHLGGVQDSTFSNLRILDSCNTGMYLAYGAGNQHCKRLRFRGIDVVNPAGKGIHAEVGTRDLRFDACQVISAGTRGADIWGRGVVLSACQIHDCGGIGVNLQHARSVVIGCDIVGNGEHGVRLGLDGHYCVVSNNRIWANSTSADNTYAGVFVDGESGDPVLYPQILHNSIGSDPTELGDNIGGQHSDSIVLGDYHTDAVVNGNSVYGDTATGALDTTWALITGAKTGDVLNGRRYTGDAVLYGVTSGMVVLAVRQSAAQSVPNGGVVTPINFNVSDLDLLSCHDPVTNNSRWMCPATGWWILSGAVAWSVDTTGSYRATGFRMDGTTIIDSSYSSTAIHSTEGLTLPTRQVPVYLNAGQYVELFGYHNATGAVTTNVTFPRSSRFTVVAG